MNRPAEWAEALVRTAWAQITRHVHRMGLREGLLWLLLANLLVTVPLVSAMQADADPDRESRTDLYLFRDRAGTILDGGWLYQDTEHVTLTPPLINYILTVPILAGDSIVAWELYLSLWNFAVAALLFGALRPLHAGLGFVVGLFYVSSPFGYATSVAMVQDDTVVPFFVAASMLALLAGRHTWSGFWSGLGTLVKAWPGIAAPVVFLSAPTWRQRMGVAAAGLGVALLVSLPFLLFVPEAFQAFLRFYVLGKSPDGDFDGLSVWRFLWLRGWGIPQQINLGILLAALAFVWWCTWRRRIAPLVAFAASFLLLLVAYPKLHFGYYLLGLVVALPWAATRWQRLAGLAAASGVARLAHLYWREEIPTAGAGIFVAIALAVTLMAYWAWWLVTVWRAGDFRATWDQAAEAPRLRRSAPSSPPAVAADRPLAAPRDEGPAPPPVHALPLAVAVVQLGIGVGVALVTWIVRTT